MNWNLLLGSLVLLSAMIGTCQQAPAGFLIDGFNTPSSTPVTNASIGQSTDTTDSLGNKRVVNVTALFDSTVQLAISGGTATYTVAATGSSPSASLTLSYSDPTASQMLANYEAIVLNNVSSTNNWSMTVTLKGTGSPLTSTYSSPTPVITAGYNGDLKILLSQFTTSPSPYSFGPLSDIQFLFTTTSPGQLSLGSMNVSTVPEPAWLGLLSLAVPMWRRRSRS